MPFTGFCHASELLWVFLLLLDRALPQWQWQSVAVDRWDTLLLWTVSLQSILCERHLISSDYGASVLYCIVCLQVEAQKCLCWKWLRKQRGEREGKGFQISAGGFLADFSSRESLTTGKRVMRRERRKGRGNLIGWIINKRPSRLRCIVVIQGHPICQVKLLPQRVLGSLHFIMQIKILYLLRKHLEKVCMKFYGIGKCNFFRKVCYI